MTRRAYVDWLRGIAVLAMIEWHAFDAWTRPDARGTDAWLVIRVVGSIAAPLFLFLAGLSLALALEARRLAGVDQSAAAWALQRRGWQIFGLAHLFRLQSFLLNPNARVSSLFKPDILNVMGLGLVACAFCLGRASSRGRQTAWLLGPALLIVALAPLAPAWWWPSLLPVRLEAYIRPVGSYGVFSLFPWLAFIFAGAASGTMLLAGGERRLGIAGALVAAAGLIGMFLPAPLRHSSFWTTSLSFFLIRTGAMMAALTLAWAWMRDRSSERSPLVLFGRTSLVVYWIHVEVAYGVLTYPLHGALALGWAAVAVACLTALMFVIARAWARRGRTQNPPAPMVRSSVVAA